ncbi:hypothetical protein Tco_0033673 [Tanacetum coccineum]
MVPHALFEKIYYCQTSVKLTLGLREIKSAQDITEMMKVGYESGNEIDMYVEHFGYDIMEMVELEVNEEHNHNRIEESDDEYYGSDDYEEIENQTETPLADPDDHQIHVVNKVQSGVLYPAFDPDIPWDKMEPTQGMRYETPYQLKLALANYGVAHGNKDRVMKNKVRSSVQIGVKKKVVKKKILKKKVVKKKLDSDFREGISQSPKWTKKQTRDSKQVVCPFRILLCIFFKEMIEDPFMPLRKMRADIRQKFMIDVSLHDSCGRAKQLTLFDHEGGLIEHYGKLYQYRQVLLDSNPGSTCRLDVDESSNGFATFKRIFICFKGVKDGWLLGCRKVIDNWSWFLHLLYDDLSLNDGNGITIISVSHKRLIDAVNDWLPEIMDQIKQLDEGAYDYLIQRNPNSWSRAFFKMDRRCASFENGIYESFNRAILEPRHKPIITIMWELSSVPCVHAVAAYLHCGIEIDLGVSHWGRGRGGSENEASDSGMGGIDEVSGGGRGATEGRGRRGRGMESSVRGIRGGGKGNRQEYQLQLDKEAFKECMEEQSREQAKNDAEQERLDKERREEREWEENNDYFNPANFRGDSLEEASFNHTYAEVFIPSIHSQPTQQSDVWVKDTTDVTIIFFDEFFGIEISATTNVAEGIGSAMEEELSAPVVDKGK